MVRALTNMTQVMNMAFVQWATTNNTNHVNIPILVVAENHKDQAMDEETWKDTWKDKHCAKIVWSLAWFHMN